MIDKDAIIKYSRMYHHEHGVNDYDVEKANMLKEAIEKSRIRNIPRSGDIVICKGPNVVYPNGHLELNNPADYSAICVQPSLPFTFLCDEELSFSTSGGYWFSVPDISFMQYVGTREKLFKSWGHRGACGNGAFSFPAIVNVWEVFLESIY